MAAERAEYWLCSLWHWPLPSLPRPVGCSPLWQLWRGRQCWAGSRARLETDCLVRGGGGSCYLSSHGSSHLWLISHGRAGGDWCRGWPGSASRQDAALLTLWVAFHSPCVPSTQQASLSRPKAEGGVREVSSFNLLLQVISTDHLLPPNTNL